MDVHGELNPMQWKDVSASALIRYSSREGFWKSGIHASVMKLAGLFHGTGMQPTAGLFDPSTRVVEAVAWMQANVDLWFCFLGSVHGGGTRKAMLCVRVFRCV